ncbi:MAG: hypothetical protein M0P13_12445 [Fibrobacteraceae bacterium]|nr:hypothetical protein [Fibrobacteraceae bacterium]
MLEVYEARRTVHECKYHIIWCHTNRDSLLMDGDVRFYVCDVMPKRITST